MKKSYIIIINFILSILCLIMPIYYDLQGGWNRTEFVCTAVGFCLLFNFLFYYIYKNFQSKFKLRKYALTTLTVIVVIMLASAGFYDSSDIPTLGAMLLYAIILLPILCVGEWICQMLQRKRQ